MVNILVNKILGENEKSAFYFYKARKSTTRKNSRAALTALFIPKNV